MTKDAAARQIRILLIEDNPGDVRLMMEALKEGKIRNSVDVAEDGVEAMAYLRQEGKYQPTPRPDLILLDLNLPRKSGQEVLSEVKQDPELRRIPVVILTSSDAEQDVLKAYNNHVNCYITKPVDLNKFLTVVRSIESFWLTVVKLPPE